MTGLETLFVFVAGMVVGAVAAGVIHAERRDRPDQWQQLARRDREGGHVVYFQRHVKP